MCGGGSLSLLQLNLEGLFERLQEFGGVMETGQLFAAGLGGDGSDDSAPHCYFYSCCFFLDWE